MDPVYRFPASPGTPLFPVSPERVNRQHLPQSPSLPSELVTLGRDPFATHSRNSSDVQGKVAQFNNLSKEATQRRRDNEAALKRAVVGREEAESETRKTKEENRTLRRDVEEGKTRERRVGERLEAVMEEMQRLKETQAHSQALYEKEVRRARKEAFKSSSALVKLQEELKTTRNRFTLMREDVEVQKRKVENREQETFTAQYQLVGVQEELEALKRQVKVTEEERDTLKTSLKDEEVARIAAEASEWDEFSSPKKPRLERRDSGKENRDPVLSSRHEETEEELEEIKQELAREKRLRSQSDELVEFMKIECQLERCSCRLAEQQGTKYIHDIKLELHISQATRDITNSPHTDPERTMTPTPQPKTSRGRLQLQEEEPEDAEPLIEFSPTTGTFRTVSSPAHPPPVSMSPLLDVRRTSNTLLAPPLAPMPLSESPSLLSLGDTTTPRPSTLSSHPPSPCVSVPSTPFTLPSRTRELPQTTKTASKIFATTITTTIPLADPFSPVMPFTPGSTMTREQALEQIRLRRGRARSVAMGAGTPRRVLTDVRRDVSAPVSAVVDSSGGR